MKLNRWILAAVAAMAAIVISCVNPVDPPEVEVDAVPGSVFILTPADLVLGSPFTMVERGTSVQFAAAVYPAGVPQDVDWSLASAIEGVGISPAGLLTIGAGVQTRTQVEVRATATDTDVTATARLLVVARQLPLAPAPVVRHSVSPYPDVAAGAAAGVNFVAATGVLGVDVGAFVTVASGNRSAAIRNNFLEIDLTGFFAHSDGIRVGENLAWTVSGDVDLSFVEEHGDDFVDYQFGLWDAIEGEWVGGEGNRPRVRHGGTYAPRETTGLIVREERGSPAAPVYVVRLPLATAASWTYIFLTDDDNVFTLEINVTNPLVPRFGIFSYDGSMEATAVAGAYFSGNLATGTIDLPRGYIYDMGADFHESLFAVLVDLTEEDLDGAFKVYTIGGRRYTFPLVPGDISSAANILSRNWIAEGQTGRAYVYMNDSADESRTEIPLLHMTPSIAGDSARAGYIDSVLLNIAGRTITIEIGMTQAERVRNAIDDDSDISLPFVVDYVAGSTPASLATLALTTVQQRVDAVVAGLDGVEATVVVSWAATPPAPVSGVLAAADYVFNVAITGDRDESEEDTTVTVNIGFRNLPADNVTVSYTIPATSPGANAFWLNLNEFHDNPALAATNVGRPRVVTSANNVTYTFYAGSQTVAITLTEAQRTALRAATAVSIYIDGDLPAASGRILLGNASAGGDWNATTTGGLGAWGALSGKTTGDFVLGAMDRTYHLLIQIQAPVLNPATMVIRYIRISYTPALCAGGCDPCTCGSGCSCDADVTCDYCGADPCSCPGWHGGARVGTMAVVLNDASGHTTENPNFAGFGGVGGTNMNSFNFSNGQAHPGSISFPFPTEAAEFDTIRVTLTLTRLGASAFPMKLEFSNTAHNEWGGGLAWQESATDGQMMFTGDRADFTYNTLVIRHNRDDSANFTITVTEIAFFDGP